MEVLTLTITPRGHTRRCHLRRYPPFLPNWSEAPSWWNFWGVCLIRGIPGGCGIRWPGCSRSRLLLCLGVPARSRRSVLGPVTCPVRIWPGSGSGRRKLFARVDADILDQLIGAFVWTRTSVVGGRRVIALDGKTVRGARSRGCPDQCAPHLVAAFDHTAGTVIGQVAVTAKSNEIPAVRTLLATFDLYRSRGHRRRNAHPDRHGGRDHQRRW